MSSPSVYRRRAKKLEDDLNDANERIKELETTLHDPSLISSEIHEAIGKHAADLYTEREQEWKRSLQEMSDHADNLAAECEALLTALRPFAEATNQTAMQDGLTPEDWERARVMYANSLGKK